MEYQYGNVSSPFRQYDIPYAYPKFYTIPEVAPGRIMADDFIYLSYPGIKDPSRYSVIVEKYVGCWHKMEKYRYFVRESTSSFRYVCSDCQVGYYPTRIHCHFMRQPS